MNDRDADSTEKEFSLAKAALCSLCLCGYLFCLFPKHLHAQQTKTPRISKFQSKPHYQALRQALHTLARAEIAREEATLASPDKATTDEVRKQIRLAISQLQTLDQTFSKLLQQGYQKRPSQRDKNDWSTRELESLLRNLKVQQARAYRSQALCYPHDSADRMNALTLALDQLSNVVTLPIDGTAVWQARVEQVVCLRFRKRFATARQQIQYWRKAQPPTAIESRLLGEALKLDLAAGDLDQAVAAINSMSANTTVAPETDEAILEVLLTARQQNLASRFAFWTNRAIQQFQHISATHSAYWKRRAEARLGQAFAAQTNTDDPKLLSYAAASLYAANKPQQAIATYDRIAELLTNKNDTDRRFQARKTAAAIAREINQRGDALHRFRQLALDQPQHSEAAQVHLIAIGLSGELIRESTENELGTAFEDYFALLKEHLERWPKQPSAPKVQQWLAQKELPNIKRKRAQTLASLGQRQSALELYRELVKEFPNDGELLEDYAEVLTVGIDEKELRMALQVWLQIENRSKPGGPRWARGRRARLILLDKLGEGEQANRLRQLTKILYPKSINDEAQITE